jgi:hypothetical protein
MLRQEFIPVSAGLVRFGSVVPLLERLEALEFSFYISLRLGYMKKWRKEVSAEAKWQ